MLRDDQDAQVHEMTQPLQNSSGIVGIDLLSDPEASPLKFNHDYHWYLSIICNPEDRAEDVVVEGWIRRVELSTALNQTLATATPQQKVALYQQAGIWNEALSMLVTLRQSEPNNATVLTQWQQLLKSVGLESVLQETQETQASH